MFTGSLLLSLHQPLTLNNSLSISRFQFSSMYEAVIKNKPHRMDLGIN